MFVFICRAVVYENYYQYNICKIKEQKKIPFILRYLLFLGSILLYSFLFFNCLKTCFIAMTINSWSQTNDIDGSSIVSIMFSLIALVIIAIYYQ